MCSHRCRRGTDARLARLATAAEADVVCVGHVHVPYHRVMTADDGRRVHYVSSGSAGKSKDGDLRACWVELVLGAEAEVRAAASDDAAAGQAGRGSTWVAAVVHRVAYDAHAVAAAMRAAGLPGALADDLLST